MQLASRVWQGSDFTCAPTFRQAWWMLPPRLLSLFAIAMMAGRLIASQLPESRTTGFGILRGLLVAAATVLMLVAKSTAQARVAAILAVWRWPRFFRLSLEEHCALSPKVHGSIIGIIFVMGFLGHRSPRVIGSLAKGSSVQNGLKLLFPLAILLIVFAVVAAMF